MRLASKHTLAHFRYTKRRILHGLGIYRKRQSSSSSSSSSSNAQLPADKDAAKDAAYVTCARTPSDPFADPIDTVTMWMCLQSMS